MSNRRLCDRLQAILSAADSMRNDNVEKPDPEYYDNVIQLLKESIECLIDDIKEEM